MTDQVSELPRIAQLKPFLAELHKSRRYFWCACGLSRNQPFCDGSHKGTGIEPVPYTAQQDGEEVLFCGCKRTADAPFCDGAHNNVNGAYELDNPDSKASLAVRGVAADPDGLAMLDGGCYVLTPAAASSTHQGSLQVTRLISAGSGSYFQSQFLLEQGVGDPTAVHFPDSHVFVFVTGGTGQINIAGNIFEVAPNCGVYIRPGEHFALIPGQSQRLTVFASACPRSVAPEFPDSVNDVFDIACRERVAVIDEAQRTAMGERFFQVLIGQPSGCEVAALFIGEIPTSKAAPHRHLYEESLIVLAGAGVMWTESRKAPVKAGDIIFLPRKQLHSLQCTCAETMLLAGVISPGTNPGINYS